METTTAQAVEAVAWERAPRHRNSFVNRRIVCADGYAISVQASGRHYCEDSDPNSPGPYWRGMLDATPVYPFVNFEVGNPEAEPTPAAVWDQYESGGVWARVPRQVVADLLDAHGGAVSWEESNE